jgi:hypothetical protein
MREERKFPNAQVTFLESRYDNAFFRTRRCGVRRCVKSQIRNRLGTEGIGQSVSNLEHGASECCVFTLKLYKGVAHDFESASTIQTFFICIKVSTLPRDHSGALSEHAPLFR